jgi:translation initiation factor IF-2
MLGVRLQMRNGRDACAWAAQFEEKARNQREHNAILLRLRREAKRIEQREDAQAKELAEAKRAAGVADAVGDALALRAEAEEEARRRAAAAAAAAAAADAAAAAAEEAARAEEVARLQAQLHEKETRAQLQREKIEQLKQEQLSLSLS